MIRVCIWCRQPIEADRHGYWYTTNLADEAPWYCAKGLPIVHAHRPESL